MSVLTETLTDQGYRVEGFTDGRKALEALKERDFDLILTDLMMPELDGMALLREAFSLAPYIVGIMMTGQGTIPTAVEAMKIGAFDYVLKPFTLANLLPVIDRAMAVHRLRMENVQLRETVAIYELSTTIAFSLDINTLLNKTVEAAHQQVNADEVSIMLPAPEGGSLYVAAVAGGKREKILGQRVRMNDGIAGWVANHREAVALQGKVNDPRFSSPLYPRNDLGSSISLPMLSGGELIGVLNVNLKSGRRPLTLGQAKALSILVSTASSALESAKLYTEVRNAEEKFRCLVEQSNEGIVLTDEQGLIIEWNNCEEQITGIPKIKALGMPLWDLMQLLISEPPDSARSSFLKLQWLEMLQSGQSPWLGRTMEFSLYRQDGTLRYVEMLAYAVRTNKGYAIGSSFRDITERKQAEKNIRDLARFPDENPDPVIRISTDGVILYANRASEPLLSFWQCRVGELMQPAYRQYIQGVIEVGENCEIEFSANERTYSCLLVPILEAGYVNGYISDITLRKQSEQALRESEEKYRTTLASIGDAVITTDALARVTYLNQVAEQLTGWTSQEAAGLPAENIFTIVNELTREPVENPIQKVLREGAVVGMANHTALIARDGRLAPIEDSGAPILDAAGQMVGVVLVFHNVAEKRKTESALRLSEAKFRSYIEHAPIAVFVADRRGNYVDANHAAEELLGYRNDLLLKLNLADVTSEVDLPIVLRDFSAIIKEGFVEGEYRLKRQNGSLIWVSLRAVPIGDDRVIAFCQDIHDRKLSEQALRDSETKYRTLVENIPQRIFAKDSHSVYLSCNASMARALGIQPDAIAGRTDYDFYPQEIADRYLADDRRIMETGKIEVIEEKYQKEGQQFWGRTFKTPIRENDGAISGILGIYQDITEEKKSEQALVQSEIRLKLALGAAQMGVWEWDIKTDAVYWSPECYEILALERKSETLGSFTKLVHPEDVEAVLLAANEGLAKKKFYTAEFRLIRPDGMVRWLSNSGQGTYDENGSPLTLIGTVQDISERKQSEQALRESEAKYRTLVDNIPEKIFTKDRNSVFLSCNKSMAEDFGISADEIRGRTDYDFSSMELADKYRSDDRRIMESGCTEIIEEKGVSHDLERWIQTIKTPIRDKEGTVTGILGIFHDITERMQDKLDLIQYRDHLEDLVKERTEKLSKSEAELKKYAEEISDLYNNAPCGYHSLDHNGVIVQINDTELEWLGYTRNELIGKKFLELIPPADQIIFQRQFPEFQKNGVLTNITGQLIRKDNSILPVMINSTVMFDEKGNFITSRDVVIDDTERLHAEKVMREAKETAESANRAKSIFLANMSHEIRTPMNAILGFSQLMLRDPSFSQSQRQHLESINRSGEHLLNLINDILEMSKIEAGRTTLNPTTFDLNGLIRDLDMMFRVRTIAKSLDFEVIVHDDLPRYIVADENKLHQIFINLLGNAVKFTDHGSITWRTWSENAGDGKLHLVSEVEDTGPGIAPEEIGKLFQTFQQTTIGERHGGGTGLGLAISAKFVQLMGGEIKVSSEVGKNCIFRFNLEIQEAKKEEIIYIEPPRRVIRVNSKELPYRILVVDDNLENRLLVVEQLHTVGFMTYEAANGKEAVQAFLTWEPHLILMDIYMPVMNGYVAIRQIRAMDKGRELPIIALTANAFKDDEIKAMDAGADGYLRKPFKDFELFAKIQGLLGLQFEYEGDSHPPQTGKKQKDLRISTKTFKELPEELIASLRQAILTANMTTLLGLIEQIRQQSPQVGNRLQQLAIDYQYDRLLAMLPKKKGR